MTWNPDKFKLLGIWFTNKIESMTELNMKDKFNEIKKLFNIWIKRSSTPIGRVVILKSLILSKLIYLWIMLPNPPDKFIRELQEKCFDFIWDGKRDKIKRSIATLHTKEGGINIPDIKTYIDALKITWINRLIKDPPAKWKHILENKHENIRLINSVGTKCLKDSIDNPFWNDVINAYDNLNSKIDVKTSNELLAEPIFYNENVQVNKKTIENQYW